MAQTLTPMMLVGYTSWEKVREIDSIIAEMETGIFINSARLVDQVLRDARVCSTAFTRFYGLLGKPMKLNPASPRRGRQTAPRVPLRSDFAQRIADETKDDWPRMVTHDALVELLLWGVLHGIGLAQVIQEQDYWCLEVWHPWSMYWREDLRQYVVMTREDSEIFIESDGNGGFVGSDGTRWVLYTPFGYANAFRRGLLRAAARLYLERQWVHRDRARYSEVHGEPIRLGEAPASASDQEVHKFEDDIARVGTEAVMVVRKGVEGNQWGLSLVEAKGSSHELFENALEQLDREIATLFLGQSQTTDGQSGLGSNDQAGEPVRLDIMKADADSLSACLRVQFLQPYCEWAYGRGDMAPTPSWQVEPPEDKAQRATELKDLMTALASAKQQGIPVDARATLEEFGVAMISEEEQAKIDAQNKADAQAKAQAAKAMQGGNDPNAQDAPAVVGEEKKS